MNRQNQGLRQTMGLAMLLAAATAASAQCPPGVTLAGHAGKDVAALEAAGNTIGGPSQVTIKCGQTTDIWGHGAHSNRDRAITISTSSDSRCSVTVRVVRDARNADLGNFQIGPIPPGGSSGGETTLGRGDKFQVTCEGSQGNCIFTWRVDKV